MARASVDWEDVTGATADGSGPYHAGTDPAQAILSVPVLAVTKTPDAGSADAGDDASYTIVVANTGSVRARNVAVTDTLPAGVVYTAGSATSGGADAGFAETDGTGPGLAWEIDGLDAGQQLTITLPVRLDASLDAGTALVNTAAATSDERPDPASDTGTFTSDTHVDLVLDKSGPATAKAGEVVTWTLHAVNDGPSDARDVELTDTLPAEVTFVDADAGCTEAAGVVTCAIGTLTPGQDVTRTVRTRIDPGALATAIVNEAHVGGSVAETDASNNDASATIATGNAVDLELTKTTTTPTVAQTLDATWKLHVVNQGPSDAYDVQLVDTLPDGVDLRLRDPRPGHLRGRRPGDHVRPRPDRRDRGDGRHRGRHRRRRRHAAQRGRGLDDAQHGDRPGGQHRVLAGARHAGGRPVGGQERPGRGAGGRRRDVHADRPQRRPVAGDRRRAHRRAAGRPDVRVGLGRLLGERPDGHLRRRRPRGRRDGRAHRHGRRSGPSSARPRSRTWRACAARRPTST